MNLVLTGPMGAGKTTIGMRVARALGMEFADTDSMAEEKSGRTICELFSKDGEGKFRELEKEIIKDISKKDNLVIAAGGGAVLDPENMRRLRSNGIIVTLEAAPAVLLERLKGVTDRPLLAVGQNRGTEFGKYLEERAAYYSNTDFRLNTGKTSIEESVGRLLDIAQLPPIRICGCISGKAPEADIRTAIESGVSMVELRLDLIPNPDVKNLVRNCAVPVIATDRKNKARLKEAIQAGCEFVDIEVDSVEKDEIIKLARQNGCKVIVSLHDFDGIPNAFPEKGDADLLKIAVTVKTKEDVQELVNLHSHRDDVIIVGMGPHGTPLRLFSPLLGSYLTYCSVRERTAPGQTDLQTMVRIYREMGLR